MMWKSALALSCLVILVGFPAAATEDCFDYTANPLPLAPSGPQIAAAGGGETVAMIGSTLCYGTSTCIQFHDVSDPLVPVWLAELPVACDRMAVFGTVLYTARQAGGLQAIDVGDPTAPVITASFANARGTWDMVVHDQHLYLTPDLGNGDGWFGLTIYDLADPTRPVLVNEADGPAGFHVCTSGDLLYMANYDPNYSNISYVTATDLSDPDAPVFLGGWTSFSGRTRDVAALGDVLYAVTNTHGLQVVDMSDPAAPVNGVVLSELIGAYSVAVVGETAWVAVRDAGGQNLVYSLSLADPAHPQILAGAPYEGSDQAHVEADGWMYLACGMPGPCLIDISDPAAPTAAAWAGSAPGHWDLTARGTDALGDLLYVASDTGDPLRVFDVSDPLSPQQVASVPGDRDGWDVVVHGDLLFLLVRDTDQPSIRGLDAYSLADPAHPQFLGRGELPASFSNLAATGGAVYGFLNGMIHVIDVRDPYQPIYVKALNPDGYGQGSPLRVQDDHLYAAAGSGGFLIYDISSARSPVLAGQLPLEGCKAVDVEGDRAIVLDFYEGLMLVDIGDPTDPSVLAQLAPPATGYRVEMDGDSVLLTTVHAQSWFYRITDEGTLEQAGEIVQAIGTRDMTVVGPWIALAQASAGVQLVWRDCGASVAGAPDELPATPPGLAIAPNPFNPRTTITYAVTTPGPVEVAIYDLTGRRLASLHAGWRETGRHVASWDGRNDAGQALPSAVYLVRVRSTDGVTSGKLSLVR